MTRAALPLGIALALLPAALVLQSRLLAPVALLALLAAVALGWRAGWRPGALPRLAWPALALLGWAALSALWSPEPGRALDVAARLAGMVVLTALAAQAIGPAPRLARWLCGGLLAGLALAVLDQMTGHAVRAAVRGVPPGSEVLGFGLKNAMAGMALLAPLAFAAPGLPLPARAALAAATLGAALLLPGEAAKIAALAGLAAAILCALRPRLAGQVIGLGAALLVLGAPFLALGLLGPGLDLSHWPPSAAHRLLIWDFVGARIWEHPWLGWGMEASRAIPGGSGQASPAVLARFGLGGPFFAAQAQLLPLHPHNLGLQLWLELGMVGAALGGWLLWELGKAARSPAACGALAAGLAVAMLSYGAWQYWWVAGLLLAAVVAAATRPSAV
ncbi:O-antigen ligase family protein [Roseococcus sp. DSY-14]|uniref:O-antigen ligase family protein n=1 Tax=Roseococcus sp. DSY-14 TaxID=3369650 RepID=UPI00387B75BB